MTSRSWHIRLGTRGSLLARRQADLVALAIRRSHPRVTVETVVVDSAGDRDNTRPLWWVETPGIFTADLTQALRAGAIDVAVHSCKDVPVTGADDVLLAATLRRDDPRDVLIHRRGWSLQQLPEGATIGTCSLRRRAQLLAFGRGVRVSPIRGNVPSRLDQVADGRVDGVIAAVAGLNRLGVSYAASAVLPVSDWVPAAAQGAIALEARAEDGRTRQLLSRIDHVPTSLGVLAERSCVAALGGGCGAPVGVLSRWLRGHDVDISGVVFEVEGRRMIRATVDADVRTPDGAVTAGRRLADQLRREGAQALIDDARAMAPSVR